MIHKLKKIKSNLNNKQQDHALIWSQPNFWETVSQNLMHNENIKICNDTSSHLELKTERLETAKPKHSTYMAESSLCKASRSKH